MNWTRDQLILAFNLYCKIGFSRIKFTRPEIIELGALIDRTPSAVAFKLVNFARLDPALQKRGVKGMKNGSKAEQPIWDEFHSNWEELSFESEKLLAKLKAQPIEQIAEIETSDLPKEGKEREAIVKVRVNQHFFRKTVLASYKNTCCITGLQTPQLLAASHIIGWSENKDYRMLPENGLCMNVLHHKAFDAGLITISDKMNVIVAPKLLKNKKDIGIAQYFTPFHERPITLPNRFLPNPEFLEFHRQKFKANF